MQKVICYGIIATAAIAGAQLDELQQKLSEGFYDERELDETMGAMQQVVQSNRLAPRDRDILGDDLSRMRDFQPRNFSACL